MEEKVEVVNGKRGKGPFGALSWVKIDWWGWTLMGWGLLGK